MKRISKVFLIIMVGVIGFAGGVYADDIIQSLDVTYDNSESGLESTNVQDALDELYVKAGGKLVGSGINLVTYISDLYTNASKSTVTNNSVTYNYASGVGLMNDRLGGTTSNFDAGNIRYYGANPNNYIFFNCSDYSNQTESSCELWRIIGVMKSVLTEDGIAKDLIKLVRASSIGAYGWDDPPSALESDNNWHEATLKTILNEAYYKSGSTSVTGTSISFASNGIKNSTTRNMIAEVTWNLGGWNSGAVYSNQIYEYERGTLKCSSCTYDTTWNGKIALMYPSDFGYATNFSNCSSNLNSYNTSGCYNNDWLFKTSTYQWFLTLNSGPSVGAWYMNNDGRVFNYYTLYFENDVFPVFYLDPEVSIEEGNTGTSEDPYRIVIS